MRLSQVTAVGVGSCGPLPLQPVASAVSVGECVRHAWDVVLGVLSAADFNFTQEFLNSLIPIDVRVNNSKE